jgi:hypothetical protein
VVGWDLVVVVEVVVVRQLRTPVGTYSPSDLP